MNFLFALVLSLLSFSNSKLSKPVVRHFVVDSLTHKALHRVKIKQHKTHKDTDEDCIYTLKYTVTQRLKLYPFSKAAKIEAVSYRYMDPRRQNSINDSIKIYDDSIRTKTPDSLWRTFPPETKYESGLHIKNQKLNHSSLIEIKQLDAKQIENLTNLIFNTTTKKTTNYPHTGYTCYAPRNALIFYDKNGKVYDYLEICFECNQFRSLYDKIFIGSYCNQKFDLFKQFFIDVGIQHGTVKKD